MTELPVRSHEVNYVLTGADRTSLMDFDDKLEWKEGTDLFAILVELGVFPSRGQARKNWKGPTTLEPNLYHWFERVGQKRLSIVVKT